MTTALALANDRPHLRHQRVDGAASVRFVHSAGASRLADLYQRAPCRFLFPNGERGEFPLAVALTTSGGLTGGDRIDIAVSVGEGACGSISTQAAEKLYRVLPGDPAIAIATRIEIAAGGRAEWLAQEAIAFDQTRLNRRTEARLYGEARLLAVESLVLGRSAMGERFRSGAINDQWRVWRDGRLVWADGLHLSGDIDGLAALPWGLGDATALSTLVYVGPDAETLLPLARDLTDGGTGGATLVNGILLLRLLAADAAALRGRVSAALCALRAATFGLPPRLPAVWTC